MNQTRTYIPGSNVSSYTFISISKIIDIQDKLKCTWNKYKNSETMKVTSSSAMYKTIHHYGSC